MSNLNNTPSGERVHIAFFGKRNAGKSSLVNAFTGQNLSIVSDIKGTTTDPVYKAMELLPLGAVMIIDTPGIDDEGALGEMRVKKTRQVLNKTDIAVLVTDGGKSLDSVETELLELIKAKNIPYIIVCNKSDLLPEIPDDTNNKIYVSAKTGFHIQELKEKAARLVSSDKPKQPLVSDLLSPGDIVLLVVPIDKAAPKGRLILPQQQTIRDILDAGAVSVVCRDTELSETLKKIKPKMVITDSQAFAKVSKIVPHNIPLTSFSILMARYKGSLPLVVSGAKSVENLQDGDKVLIAEGCTHHRQCNDIGTVKLPAWIQEYTKVSPEFSFTSGTEFPENLSEYKLVVHCGACMLGEKEVKSRFASCRNAGIPVTNYGILIAYLNGILKRTLEPFPTIQNLIT